MKRVEEISEFNHTKAIPKNITGRQIVLENINSSVKRATVLQLAMSCQEKECK
jgi:hypothetical protein